MSRVTPHASANRVVYRHAGLSEWYVNGPAELEHGFTLARPRPGRPEPSLDLALAVPASRRVQVDRDRRGATFSRTPRSRGTRACGQPMPAVATCPRGCARRGRQLVTVDDRRARYPMTIDPFFQARTSTASDACRE